MVACQGSLLGRILFKLWAVPYYDSNGTPMRVKSQGLNPTLASPKRVTYSSTMKGSGANGGNHGSGWVLEASRLGAASAQIVSAASSLLASLWP